MTAPASRRRFRYVAPAGAPIPPLALATWLRNWIACGDARHALAAALCARVGAQHCDVFSTGRAGMTVLMRALHRLAGPGRNEVIVPAYTCYSVAASAVKAGLRPRLADIDPATLDFDYERLGRTDLRRVVAIVGTNLYGLPNDAQRLAAIAAEHRVAWVDDAAQALGATIHGRPCGTSGDAGLFSFDKGKNVSAIDGGAVVTNSRRVADAMVDQIRALPSPTAGEAIQAVMKLGAYVALLRPELYWIPNSIPQLGLGQTVFTTEYPVEPLSQPLAALALTMLDRLDDYTKRRRANAAALLDALRGAPGVHVFEPCAGARPAYVRLPLLLPTRDARDGAIAALNRAGIGATGSYPASLADVAPLQPHLAGGEADAQGAREVASRIITLPTHPYVTSADVASTVTTLLDAIGGARATAAYVPSTRAVTS